MPFPDFIDLIDRFDAMGREALPEQDVLELAGLFVREARKAAFRYSDFDPIATRIAFVDHVRREFAPSADPKVVVDYTFTLLRQARALAKEPHPIASVILYATWLEHWLNSVLITKALRLGRGEADAGQMVRDVGMLGKLGWLWRELDLPPLADQDLKRLRLLAEVRNEFVHYKWKGKDPAVLDGPDQRLAEALTDLEATLSSVWRQTSEHLDGQITAYAKELFGADFGAAMADLWEFADA